MLEIIQQINTAVSNFIWGAPAMAAIVGVGILLAIRTRLVQVRKFPAAMKTTLGKLFDRSQAREGTMSPFQAVCTALAGTVGTGNIAGVAGALALGGPGAVFWMWCSAFLGMGTKFAEVTLAVHFRETNPKGEHLGGPMYYIKNGLGRAWLWLAFAYAIFGVLTVFGTGNATQVNTIVTSVDSFLDSFGILPSGSHPILNLGIGIVMAIIVGMVLLGGVKRIGAVSERLVPFMALLYIFLGLGVIVLNWQRVPGVFGMIFRGAFDPRAVTGGVVGSAFLALQKGVSRGIFSNEAGLGTGSIAHSTADTDDAIGQGLFGIFEVFMDTIVICTMTALVILCSGTSVSYGQAAGAELTIAGFTRVYGAWVTGFTMIALICFAFSTIIGWGLYGSRCVEFLFGHKLVKPFLFLYALVAIVGATMDLGMIWDIAETFNGLMAIPNLVGLLLLSSVVVKLLKEKERGD